MRVATKYEEQNSFFFQECSFHFREVFRMQVTLFDIWTAETQLKELLL